MTGRQRRAQQRLFDSGSQRLDIQSHNEQSHLCTKHAYIHTYIRHSTLQVAQCVGDKRVFVTVCPGI